MEDPKIRYGTLLPWCIHGRGYTTCAACNARMFSNSVFDEMLSHILFSYTAAEPVNQSEVAPSDWGKSSIVLLDRRLLMTF